MPAQNKSKGKKQLLKFHVDCSKPVEDGILEAAHFEKFLQERIKVNGKAGNLGDAVKVKRDNAKVSVESTAPFRKAYLKYLTRKFLKKQNLRDWLRVVASSKQGYEVRYYKLSQDAEASEDED
eukprot:TRINITY_DN1276_c0_g1_i2.p1 TRINITY_DN1276_c0_g1~~TRINITY_DN1276_c0_g1_i2.p1  ORF type:complete len:123 (+),score=47.57 TRINITY_DN1276_c0_g1_i2:25-393(+)